MMFGTSLHTLVQMVDNGLGITMLPQMAIEAGILDHTDIDTRPLDSDHDWRTIALVWRKGSPRADRIVSIDPWGHRCTEVFADLIAKGYDIRPTIAVTRAQIFMPELKAAMDAGRLRSDNRVLLPNGNARVTKIAIEPVWHLPGIARRFGIDETALRREKMKSLAAAGNAQPSLEHVTIGAEERNQSEAIARNLFELSRLRTPVLATVIVAEAFVVVTLGVVTKFRRGIESVCVTPPAARMTGPGAKAAASGSAPTGHPPARTAATARC